MSLDETKQLLQAFKITPKKIFGQNFMVEPSFFPKLSTYADLGRHDVVLDVGAGLGFLSRFLAVRCKAVVAIERDPLIARVLREQLKSFANVTIVEGDVLNAALPDFTKIVAIPPYNLSTRLVMWLHDQKKECSVVILQKEFASKLVSAVGSDSYGWLRVITDQNSETKIIEDVPREVFYPQPKVDSVIVRIKPRKSALFRVKDEAFFKKMVQWLFTQRNKKLANALVPFLRSSMKQTKGEADKMSGSISFCDKRVRELSPEEFGVLANAIER
jgi:16S rRNA (adenine1518-N6/adenine1519-N6)-dimethyltransferase